MNSRYILPVLILCVISYLLFRRYYYQYHLYPTSIPVSPTISAGHDVLGQRIKTSRCIVNNKMPDSSCTPGTILLGVTKEQVCKPGYSASVRNVPVEEKKQVYEEYGIASHRPGEYEVDHLISLELGGANDIANLWPEAADPRPGFHEKDKVENYLHQQVCSGAISLQEAQQQISHNWLQVYQSLPAGY